MKNEYLSVKLLKRIIGYAFIAFLLISFHELIEDLVLMSLVEPVLSQFVGSNEIVFMLFIILVVLFFVYMIYLMNIDYKIPKQALITVIFVALIYSYYRFAMGSAFEFTPIPILNEKLFYFDIVYFVALMIVLVELSFGCSKSSLVTCICSKVTSSVKSRIEESQNQDKRENGFLKERIIQYSEVESDNQVYQRMKMVKDLIAKLKNTNLDETGSFVVGIEGPWGSGKSTFIKNMKIELLKEDDYEVFTSNPWRMETGESFQESFFNDFKIILSKYAFHANKEVNEYLSVLSPNSSRLLRFLRRNRLSETEYGDLQELIKEVPKHFIVVFDDIDRLTNEEFLELFKLIRSTANFSKLIYILGYDWNAIEKILIDQDRVYHPATYFEKLVNVEVSLPPMESNQIYSTLIQKLYDFGITEKRKDSLFVKFFSARIPVERRPPTEMEKLIDESPLNIRHYLRNVRDVYRFINDFSLVYKDLSHIVVFEEIFLLELLRFRYREVYELLSCDNVILKQNVTNNLSSISLKESEAEEIIKAKYIHDSKKVEAFELQSIIKLLKKLFPEKGMKDDSFSYSIARPLSFDRYFYRRLFDIHIDEQEFTESRAAGFEQLKSFVEDSIENQKGKDIADRLKLVNKYESSEDFFTILKVRSYFAEIADSLHSNSIEYQFLKLDVEEFIELFYENKYNIGFINKPLLQSLAKEIFKNAPYPYIFHATVLRKIYESNKKDRGYYFALSQNANTLFRIIDDYIIEYLQKGKIDEDLIVLVNLSKYSEKEGQDEIVTDNVKSAVKREISNNPDDFMRVFIKHNAENQYFRLNSILFDLIFEKDTNRLNDILTDIKNDYNNHNKKIVIGQLIYLFKSFDKVKIRFTNNGYYEFNYGEDIDLEAFVIKPENESTF